MKYDAAVRFFPKRSNLVACGMTYDEFVGNFEWRDSLVTFALKELDTFDAAWIATCPFKPIDPSKGQGIYRYVSDITRSTGVVLIEFSTGRAAFPILESADSDVIIGWKRLKKVKFINLVEKG